MKRSLRWFVGIVLVVDATAAVAYLLAGEAAATSKPAAAAVAAPATPAPVEPAPAPAVQASTPAPVEEAVTPPATEIADEPAVEPASPAGLAPQDAFLRLQRAYENMEPEIAARAVAELAARDQEAVVQLLLGWNPRTSGAILDALTVLNPTLAADLSYAIWKRGGKERPEPAGSRRSS